MMSRSMIAERLREMGIGQRLVVVILLFSSVVTLILTSFQLYLDFRRDVTVIETRLDEVRESHVQSVTASLWNVDVALLRLQMEGLARLPDVIGVEVREAPGQASDPIHLSIGDTAIDRHSIRRDYALIYSEAGQEPRPIGNLWVNASLSGVYERLLDKALVILASQGVKTFLVSLFILLMIHRIVTRHLTTISQHVAAFDLNAPRKRLLLERRHPRNDELSLMVDSFNQMNEGLERAYKELQQAKEAAEAGNQAKDRFLAVMSHELRTPMNAILGFAEVLDTTPLNEEQHRFLAQQRRASEALLALITDILEISQLDANLPKPNIEPFDLDTLFQALEEELTPKARAKGIELRVAVPEGIGAVRGDPRLIRQALMIVVGNGVKFTPEGHVSLRARRAGGTLLLEVDDTGIGIPEEMGERIFEPFVQGDDSDTRLYGGSGIGLAVARRCIAAMEGRLTAARRDGGGSAFRVEIPRVLLGEAESALNDRPPSPERPPEESALRILYAEDDLINATMVATLFEQSPHRLTIVENGALAVERIKREPFDLVLMDIQMPVMDGYRATRMIREWEREVGREPLPIYALSAHALQRDIDDSLQAGCDRHLTKPISQKRLLELVAAVESRSGVEP